MICHYVELEMETTQPRDVAKAMLRFWLYQADQARQAYTACKGKIEAAHRANKYATEEWRKSDELGFGPSLPFSESDIKIWEGRLPNLKQHLCEANAMAGYIVNFITDKAHPNEEQNEQIS